MTLCVSKARVSIRNALCEDCRATTKKSLALTADDNVFRLELEEPIVDAIHGDVGNLRGWAIADSGIEKVEIWLDDVYAFDVPHGGKRGDVSFAFPEIQN